MCILSRCHIRNDLWLQRNETITNVDTFEHRNCEVKCFEYKVVKNDIAAFVKRKTSSKYPPKAENYDDILKKGKKKEKKKERIC